MNLDSMAFARIDAGAHEAATGHNARPEPTERQKRAGNYKMGRADVHGIKVVIENPRGTYRCGVSDDGKAWSTRVAAHYGYLAGTRGADGDALDVFVGPFPESPSAWVVNQRSAGGGFDEHKVMLGCHTEEQARAAYLGSYSAGWTGLKSIVPITLDQLRAWMKTAPRIELTPDQLKESAVMDRVTWGQDAQPTSLPMNRLMYALRAEDAGEDLMLDAVSMADLMGAPELDGHVVLDALVVEVGRLQPKMDALLRVMQLAGEAVKPVSVTISEPVRARGVLNVMVLFLMDDGQTVSMWLHNPDTTPSRLAPMDELISWKWMLNKRDVTIVVAPERGQELSAREVARRLMRLVDKNTAAFKKANEKAAERAGQVASVDAEITQLTGELTELQHKIEVARVAFEAKPTRALAPIEPGTPDFVEWEDAVTRIVEEELEATRSDAQGMVEVYPQELRKAFEDGASPEEAAKIVMAPVTEEPEALAGRFASQAPAAAEEPSAEYQAVHDEGAAIGRAAGQVGDSFLPSDSSVLAATIAEYAGKGLDVAQWLREGFQDGWDEGDARRKASGASDISYRAVDEMFTAFYPNTKAGEDAWKVMAENDGTGKVLTAHVADVVRQLREKGYTVRELDPPAAGGDDALLAELQEPAKPAAPAAPAWLSRNFDPTTEAGYVSIRDNDEALSRWQDVLDPVFGERVFALRAELKELGWKKRGPDSTDLTKNGAVLDMQIKHAGRGRNVVGISYGLTGRPAIVADTFGATAQQMAKLVDEQVMPPSEVLAHVGQALGAAGWQEAEPGIWVRGDWTVYVGSDGKADFLAVDVREGAIGTTMGYVTYIGTEPADVVAKVNRIVAEEEGEAERPGSPTDAELEAEAMAGHEVSRITPNMALPKAERDALAKATLGKVFLYNAEDVARAVRAVEDAETQRDFKPFDASAIKMPTAAQLGATKDYVATVLTADGALTLGWSNGFVLDLAKTPRFIESAMVKRFGDLLSSREVRRFVKAELVERFMPKAKANATEAGEPTALWDGHVTDTKKGKRVTVPRPCVVLTSQGSHVVVQVPYFAYFFKSYPGCEFLIGGEQDTVLVRFRGAPVGIIMPFTLKNLGNIRARAAKAQAAPVATDPAAAVDAAYRFANATPEFKRLVAESLDKADYSAFVTAKAMDEKAKDRGLTVHWDVSGDAVLDGVSMFDDAGNTPPAVTAAKELVKWFREFVKSGQGLGIVPEHLPEWGGTVVDPAGARKALHEVVEASINARAGEKPLTPRQTARLVDFAADAETITEYLRGRRDHGAIGKLRTPEMKARYPHIDTQLWLDGVPSVGGDIVGTIYLGGDVVGRAEVASGDGKAMVFVGEAGDTRVTYVSQIDGQLRNFMWSDDDAGEMIDRLADSLDGGPSRPDSPGGEPKPDEAPAGSPLDAFEANGGESWKVTRAEWAGIMRGHVESLGQEPEAASVYEEFHRSQVQAALDAGKPVPEAVLADYPGMVAQSAEHKAARTAGAEAAMARAVNAMGGRTAEQEDARQEATEIAMTIRAQLGGQKFVVMTGARDFMALTRGANPYPGLKFRLPSNFATSGINRVTILLNAEDTYDVEFGKSRGSSYKVIAKHEGIYVDMLRELFTRVTGLDTSLGTVRGAAPAPAAATAQPTESEQFAAYAKAIREGGYSTGMGEAIMVDERLADGEGERLVTVGEQAAADAGSAGKYPDGRTIPVAGSSVYTRAAGMFGMPAGLSGTVEVARDGKLRVRVTSGGGALGDRYAGRKVLPLSNDWTVMGEEHPRDAAQRLASEQLKAESEARQAEHEAGLVAATERNGTVDPATVEEGDVLELADGTQVYVAEKSGDYGLFVTSLQGDAYHASGLGTTLRGVKKLAGFALPTDGSIVIGSYDAGRRALFADGWQPVEWSDDADAYVRTGASGNQARTADAPPANDPAMDEDRAYLQSFVGGTADVLADNIMERLEPLVAKYENHAELGPLLAQAMDAYSRKVMELAQAAMK